MAFNQMLDMTHGMHPLQLRGGLKILEKYLLGGQKCLFLLGGDCIVVGGGVILGGEVTEF